MSLTLSSVKTRQGFTLLELLIVIAIIGILVAVVLASMSQSKAKGADAGVRSNLLNARSQAEVYYTNQNRSYSGVCNDTSLGIFKMMQAAARAQNITPRTPPYMPADVGAWNKETCHDSVDAYAVWVPLQVTSFGASRSGFPVGLCIDSLNTTKIINADLPSSQTFCP